MYTLITGTDLGTNLSLNLYQLLKCTYIKQEIGGNLYIFQWYAYLIYVHFNN